MESVNDNDEIEIDLWLLFKEVLGHIWTISLTGLICGLIIFIIAQFIMTPTYESSAKLYIINRQNEGTTTYNDLQTSSQLVNDYKVLVVSRPVVEQVISDLQLDMTYKKFTESVTTSIASDSRVLSVNVTSTDPYVAKEIVDKLAEVSANRICSVMQIDGVNIIEYGTVAMEKAAPSVIKYTLIGFVLGILIAAAVVIIRALFDDSIKSSEDVEKYLGLSTLALIPLTEEAYSDNNRRKKKRKIIRR